MESERSGDASTFEVRLTYQAKPGEGAFDPEWWNADELTEEGVVATKERASGFARLVALARTFPSLADPAKRPIRTAEDLEQIARDQSNGSGVRQAAAFLLYVWTSGAYAWDLARGWGAWDDRHRDAWKAWATDPWFG